MHNTALLQTYREHERDLIRFLARRLRCAFAARDLAQDIYLKLHDGVDESGIRNTRSYLFRMAANLATDYLRAEARHAELLAETHELLWGGAETRTPERTAAAREQLAKLREAAARLPATSREIFHLNRFEGLTQREIADRLGVSLTTVEKHIRKALDHLAQARDSSS